MCGGMVPDKERVKAKAKGELRQRAKGRRQK
jgi:hypothetical protein